MTGNEKTPGSQLQVQERVRVTEGRAVRLSLNCAG